MLGPDDRRREEQAGQAGQGRMDPATGFSPGFPPVSPWSYPGDRYYYPWWGDGFPGGDREPSDGEIKSTVVERLKQNPHTKDDTIKVDVKQRVVVLGGDVSSWLAKRAAGDDAWDTPGVVDVSNQLRPPTDLPTSPATDADPDRAELMVPGDG
ncbi:BON domain-containing protein [Tenggerimyces flavus]|uniref:BON domain-containing protein n=1 Tax=Tenggerimyces flavus TaxID=1708749 RepID=A0ABV7YCE4_9ACTN|nr:BON domain-containing protein [Tenggerimyces flavus]MBM7786523.1 hypothetical protein [Tenggerimyces flavus]